MSTSGYKILADLVLILHFSIVLFVLGGLILIIAGNLLRWAWVNRLWFRLVHLSAILFVVAETWLGFTCPLTTLESWLREQAGLQTYQRSFIEDWVHSVLFYRAPSWVFAVAYTLFGAAVAGAWWYWPPRRRPPHTDDRTVCDGKA